MPLSATVSVLGPPKASLADSARRLAALAWPVFIGQLSVLAFGTIDTLLLARAGATELAALAVGGAAYITIFIGLAGTLMALAPIVGQLSGARRFVQAGQQVHQAVWMALALTVLGALALMFPEPFLALARSPAEVETKVRGYLMALAVSLPAALLFAVYRGFNIAIGRPRMVMLLQIAGMAIKLPLSVLLTFGAPTLGLPALGVLGCGIATAVAMWAQLLIALIVMRHDPAAATYRLFGHGLARPDFAALRAMIRLGVPIGASILVEVTGFAFMSIFIARLGTTAVAGHQIAVNLVSVLFMLPLALANASSTLVALRLGGGHAESARRLGWHAMAIGCGVAAVLGLAVFLARQPVLRLYTHDAAVIAAAMPLLAWLAVFHLADAAQTIAAFVLRAHKIAVLPMVIYVVALWGLGLGGGYALAFDLPGFVPAWLQGARGFWVACTAGLILASVGLAGAMHGLIGPRRDERPV